MSPHHGVLVSPSPQWQHLHLLGLQWEQDGAFGELGPGYPFMKVIEHDLAIFSNNLEMSSGIVG